MQGHACRAASVLKPGPSPPSCVSGPPQHRLQAHHPCTAQAQGTELSVRGAARPGPRLLASGPAAGGAAHEQTLNIELSSPAHPLPCRNRSRAFCSAWARSACWAQRWGAGCRTACSWRRHTAPPAGGTWGPRACWRWWCRCGVCWPRGGGSGCLNGCVAGAAAPRCLKNCPRQLLPPAWLQRGRQSAGQARGWWTAEEMCSHGLQAQAPCPPTSPAPAPPTPPAGDSHRLPHPLQRRQGRQPGLPHPPVDPGRRRACVPQGGRCA